MKTAILKSVTTAILAVLLFCVMGAAWCNDEPVTYDRVNLTANATAQVENDTLVATLYYQREGADPGALASEVNEKITAAIKTSKKIPNIDIQTPGYQSNPVYEKQRIIGWRVRQTLRLQSKEIAKLSKLIGELQNTLVLESINYSVSPDKLQEAEEKLTVQAIDAFKKRSLLITHQFGRTTYRMVIMSINSGGSPIRPMRMQAAAMAMETTAPTIETGKQEIQVNINGTIELQLD